MSNSLPAHPNLMAACREAMEFWGSAVFFQAPRCATTLLAAKFPFNRVNVLSITRLFSDEKEKELSTRLNFLKYFLPLLLRKSSFFFSLNRSAFTPVSAGVY